MEKKTLAEHLKQASDLFDSGFVVKAGQIWQAILKRDSSVSEARAGLLKVREALSHRTDLGTPAEEQQVARAKALTQAESAQEVPKKVQTENGPSSVPLDAAGYYLHVGRSLYDSGALTEALATWEKVLTIEPGHSLALSHVRGVRKELGLPVPDNLKPDQIVPIADNASADVHLLLPLAKSPSQSSEKTEKSNDAHNQLDTKVAEATETTLSPSVEAESKDVGHNDDIVAGPNRREQEKQELQTQTELAIEQGSHLYKIGKVEEAIHAWESVIEIDPENILVKGYLTMAQTDMEAMSGDNLRPKSIDSHSIRSSAKLVPTENWLSRPISQKTPMGQSIQNKAVPDKEVTQLPIADATAAEPVHNRSRSTNPPLPSVITQRPEVARQGLQITKKIKRVPVLSRLFSPMGLVIFLLLLGLCGLVVFLNKDAILSASQIAIKEEAIKSARQSAKVSDLTLTPEKLKDQAKSAFDNSPLMSYLLIQEVINLDSSDTSVAKLFDQAQQAMQATATAPRTNTDINRLIASGNLEEAETLLEASLRQNPNAIRTRESLARVSLLLAREFAKQGKWESARSRLSMGAALFPKDPTWQARLELLKNLQAIPKEDQSQWLELLG